MRQLHTYRPPSPGPGLAFTPASSRPSVTVFFIRSTKGRCASGDTCRCCHQPANPTRIRRHRNNKLSCFIPPRPIYSHAPGSSRQPRAGSWVLPNHFMLAGNRRRASAFFCFVSLHSPSHGPANRSAVDRKSDRASIWEEPKTPKQRTFQTVTYG